MVMVCIPKLSKISFEIQIFNFAYQSSGHYISVRKDVKIRGYFSAPKVVSEQNVCETMI